MILKTSDNFFDIETQRKIGDYCHKQYYNLFELDHPDMEPVGGTADVKGEMWDLFSNRIYSDFKDIVRDMKIYRMYINVNFSNDKPNFHTDGDEGLTFLYYPHTKWKLNDCGETQLYLKDHIYCVLPLPNRMVVFDASILHRATSFRNGHRFTVAVKCAPQSYITKWGLE
tara:strand:+ start:452 stop:961 length:510 start_codon:yes stop_codon:yes gene_type:complete